MGNFKIGKKSIDGQGRITKVHRNGDITLTAQEAKRYFDFIYIAKTLIKNFKDDLQSIEDNLFQSIINRDFL